MAERLYYQNQYLKEFEANVISCAENNGVYEVILDKTAFFPEGGGQPGDKGFIGTAEVVDTLEKSGEVIHICSSPVEVGAAECRLDFDLRFSNMQQHSGEHVFSGVVHSVKGYDNVGFHMGENYVTVDFSGKITAEELERIEKLTNDAIFRNIPIESLYPSDDELENYSYRSKKEIQGQVRLTKIGDVDLCACCGTHVAFTGEIGIVKAVSMMNYKSGVRITLQIGKKALEDYSAKNKSVAEISALLKAKPEEITAAVERILKHQQESDFRFNALKKEIFAEKSKNYSGRSCCVFDDGGLADDARIFSDMLAENVGIAAVFSGSDSNGYKYAITSRGEDVRSIGKELNSACNGRGGGKSEMIQGSVAASKEEIESFWNSLNLS